MLFMPINVIRQHLEVLCISLIRSIVNFRIVLRKDTVCNKKMNNWLILCWVIIISFHKSFGAVTSIIVSTTETEKHGNLVMSTTTNDSTIDWIINDQSPSMSICYFGSTPGCTVYIFSNMAFAASSSGLTTITITSLSYSANEGIYKAMSDSGASVNVSVIVSSPPTYVTWSNQLSSTCADKSVTLTAKIPCVYPSRNIEVIFEIFNQTGSIANSSISTQLDVTTSCESHETNLKAEITLSSKKYLDQTIRVLASVRHNLLPSKPPVRSNLTEEICFQSSSVATGETTGTFTAGTTFTDVIPILSSPTFTPKSTNSNSFVNETLPVVIVVPSFVILCLLLCFVLHKRGFLCCSNRKPRQKQNDKNVNDFETSKIKQISKNNFIDERRNSKDSQEYKDNAGHQIFEIKDYVFYTGKTTPMEEQEMEQANFQF